MVVVCSAVFVGLINLSGVHTVSGNSYCCLIRVLWRK